MKEIYFSFVDYAHLRNIHYDFQLSETPTLCWFDSQLLEKVFFNLLSNAFKYTPDNGNIIISGRTTDNEVEISISDTGSGIAKTMFHKYSRASSRQTTKSRVNIHRPVPALVLLCPKPSLKSIMVR